MKELFFISLFAFITCFCFGQQGKTTKVFDAPQLHNPADTIRLSDTTELNYCDCHGLKDHFRNYDKWNLYTKDKKISKCGYFLHGILVLGFHFVYSDSDDVIHIEKILRVKK
jgi:hypothetical protein